MPKTICVHCGEKIPKKRVVDGASRGGTLYCSEPCRRRAATSRAHAKKMAAKLKGRK